MNTLLVSYDLNRPGQDYEGLIAQLERYPGWWHNLDSTWLIKASLSPEQLRDELTSHLDANDELLVIDVTGRSAAWRGFDPDAGQWIRDHL